MAIRSTPPGISAVICTANRGQKVQPAVESILANTHPNYEVFLIDQSGDNETCAAIQPYLSDPRFHYIHSDTIGTGRSRNLGLHLAQGEVVAFLDDDVTVQPQWLEQLEQAFAANPCVAMVFCRVEPAPFDILKGYIPDFRIKESRFLKRMHDLLNGELGLGAGMAVRKERITQMGGFDDHLGPGSIFQAGEDRDLAIRAVLKGWWVYNAAEIPVVHFGFRFYKEGRAHTKRDFIGLGATYIKPIKCGYWNAIILFLTPSLLQNWLEPVTRVFRLQKPRGFRKIYYFILGVWKGIKTPVDQQTIRYKRDQNA